MERPIAQIADVLLADHVALAVHFLRLRHQAAPDGRQARHRRLAVAVELQISLGSYFIERMLDAWEIAIQVGEAAVLRVDHHDLLDLVVQRGVEP